MRHRVRDTCGPVEQGPGEDWRGHVQGVPDEAPGACRQVHQVPTGWIDACDEKDAKRVCLIITQCVFNYVCCVSVCR